MNLSVSALSEKLNLTVVAGADGLSKPVKDVYICDLLSWVMGRAPECGAWITIQGHINIIAVALLAELSCIIIAEGAEVDSATLDKANQEDIPILTSPLSAYELAVSIAAL